MWAAIVVQGASSAVGMMLAQERNTRTVSQQPTVSESRHCAIRILLIDLLIYTPLSRVPFAGEWPSHTRSLSLVHRRMRSEFGSARGAHTRKIHHPRARRASAATTQATAAADAGADRRFLQQQLERLFVRDLALELGAVVVFSFRLVTVFDCSEL